MAEDVIKQSRANITKERFPNALQQRLEDYIDFKNRDKTEQERKEFWDNYYYLIKSGSTSAIRKMTDRQYTQQTYSNIKDIIGLSKLTGKEYIEFCMKQNDMLDNPTDPGWQQIGWPTTEMTDMCGLLDNMSAEDKDKISKLISMYQPAYYKEFRKDLYAQAKAKTDVSYVNRINIDDFGFRIRLTLNYLRGDTLRIPIKACKEIGLYYKPAILNRETHEFLICHIRDIAEFCNVFELSPHWAMYGRQSITVLAKSIQTEFIMDEFCLLPKAFQHSVYRTSIKIANE